MRKTYSLLVILTMKTVIKSRKRSCGMCEAEAKMYTELRWTNLKVRDHLGDLGVGGTRILK
jgi:hypothetical protein